MKINEEKIIDVIAEQLFSPLAGIPVEAGEQYQISVEKNQKWCDSFIKTSPDGFFNPLLFFSPSRFQSAKCFCLCGNFNQNEEKHFKLGSGVHQIKIVAKSTLYFFPNDSIKHYKNNSGSIKIVIKRMF